MGTTEDRQIRAGCYCRISSDPKDRRAGVDRQREDTAVICEVNGWRASGYYVDNDRSATNGKDRPEWNRLLADVEAGNIDAIVVWNQDRGWRNMVDLETLRPVLAARGVPVATTNIGIVDFNNPDDVFRTQVSTALAEMEVAKLKVRIRRAARQKAERGEPQWKRAFGYADDHQPDPTTAPLVAEAYRAIIAGASLGDVCALFNNAGAYSLRGNPWTVSPMSQFLRKARNAGLREHNGVIVGKGTWPPLVSEETWRAAMAVMDAPGRTPGRKAVRKHLLTGVLKCGVAGCGGHLSGQWTMKRTGGSPGRPKAGEVKVHPGKKAHAITYACKSCRRCGIRAAHVEPLVYKLIGGRLARPDAVDLLKADAHDAAEAERLTAAANTLYAQIREAETEYDEGIIDGRRLAARRERVAEKLAVIEAAQQDQERLRVFDGIPLGTPEAVGAVRDLSPDRLRAVIDVLVVLTVEPVGKRGNMFNPRRVVPDWKR